MTSTKKGTDHDPHRRLALIAAALAAGATAMPASADTGRPVKPLHTIPAAANACDRSLAAASCSTFQDKLLSDTAQRVDPRQRAALQEVGRRQLDALIASIG